MSPLETLMELLAQSATNPQDTLLRFVAADAAEEAGKPEWAECLRWMGRHGKRPYGTPDLILTPFTWWMGEGSRLPCKASHILPEHILGNGRAFERANAWHVTAQEAEMALLLDWEAAVKAGHQFDKE